MKTDKKDQKKVRKKRHWAIRIIRGLVKTIVLFILLFILLILFVRSPWGQEIIIDKTTNYISEKIDAEFSIQKFFLGFDGNLVLEGLSLHDQNEEQLLYLGKLELEVPLLPILSRKEIKINLKELSSLQANIYRHENDADFNYQFIIDAFASVEEDEVADEPNEYTILLEKALVQALDIHFLDEVENQQHQLFLGEFNLAFNSFNLQENHFEISQIFLDTFTYDGKLPRNTEELSTSNSSTDNKETEEVEEDEAKLSLLIEAISLNGIEARFFQEANLKLDTKIPSISLHQLAFNLQDKTFSMQDMAWEEVILFLESVSFASNKESTNEEAEKVKDAFAWPEWSVEVGEIRTKDSHYEYVNHLISANDTLVEKTKLTHTDLVFNEILLQPNEVARLGLERFSTRFNEEIRLTELSFQLGIEDKKLDVNALQLQLLQSQVDAAISFQYKDLNQLDDLENMLHQLQLDVAYSLHLPDFSSIVNEFEVSLDKELWDELSKSRFNGRLQANAADFSNVAIRFDNQWSETKTQLQMQVHSPTTPEKLGVKVHELKLSSTDKDVYAFIAEDEAYRLPSSFNFKSSGNYRDEKADFKVNFDSEIATFSSRINFNLANESYQLQLENALVELGELLPQQDLGKVAIELSTSGKGFDIYKASNKTSLDILSLTYEDREFKDIAFSSEINQGEGKLQLQVIDSVLQANFSSDFELSENENKATWKLNIDGLNAEGLGLIDAPFNIKGIVEGHVIQQNKELILGIETSDVIAQREEQTYRLKHFGMLAELLKNETKIDIDADFIQTKLYASAQIEEAVDALQKYLSKQFSFEEDEVIEKTQELVEAENTREPIDFQLKMTLFQTNFLREIMLPDLAEIDTLQMQLNFSEATEKLNFEVSLPFVAYDDNRLSGLQISAVGDNERFQFEVNFDSVTTSVIGIDKTRLKVDKEADDWEILFTIDDHEETLFNIASKIKREEEFFVFQLIPNELILNALEWEIPTNNQIRFAKKRIEAEDFVLQRSDQRLELTHQLDFDSEHFGLVFSNFKVETFTGLLKTEEENIAKGNIKGDLVLIEPFDNWGVVSDLEINEIHIFDKLIGDFELLASAFSTSEYDLSASLKGPEIEMSIGGKLSTENDDKNIQASFEMNRLDLALIEYFTSEYLRNSKGSLSAKGKFSLEEGTSTYEARLTTNEAFFNLIALNADLYLGDEEISLNNEGLFFKKFNVQDANKNTFAVSGGILEVFTSPKFNLNAEAKNFQLLNSTREDNDLYFGVLEFDADAKIRGDINLPRISVEAQLRRNTNLTYIVPQTQAEVVDRDGVVMFVNKSNELDVFGQTKLEELKADVRGIDIAALIKINPRATVNVVLNERTGDNLRVQGGGDLQVNVRPNGTINLSGKYEVTEGHFELNLYNLVRRRFSIAENSSITWSGDPLNADLDIRAIYKVETSPSSLMAAQIVNESNAVQNRFRQQLPFLVYLDVSGEIVAPNLDFSLDMPSSDRSAIGGRVYDRITQINQREDERNKQVFALLVLNQFYPESGSDGSQGGASALARNNINQALSDQLNNFSNKMLKNTGVSLNFDLNSYTDFQTGSADERTDLDVSAEKKLFNDRVVVQAGSQFNVQGDQRPGESNVALGNVSIEYLLTRDERWKLRGFRKNEYENIIDGQLVFSGIALIFTKEFNEFRELWKALLNEEEDIEEEEKVEVEDVDETEIKSN